MPTNNPLSTTPTMDARRASSAAGSDMSANAQSKSDAIASVRHEWLVDPRPERSSGLPPIVARRSSTSCHPNTTISTGSRVWRRRGKKTSFVSSTTTIIRWLARATIFSRSKAPPSPFDQVEGERAARGLVGTVNREIDPAMIGKVLVSSSPSRRASPVAIPPSEVGMPKMRKPCARPVPQETPMRMWRSSRCPIPQPFRSRLPRSPVQRPSAWPGPVVPRASSSSRDRR